MRLIVFVSFIAALLAQPVFADDPIGDEIRKISKKLDDADPRARREAIEELQKAGNAVQEATKKLAKRLSDRDEDVRLQALISLRLVGGVTFAVNELKTCLWDTNPKVRLAAINAINSSCGFLTPDLIELLNEDDPELRLQVCLALGRIGARAKAAAPRLIELLSDRRTGANPRAMPVHHAAGTALATMGVAAKPAIAQLLRFIRDKDPDMGPYASSMLIHLGPISPDIVPGLMELLKSDSSFHRDKAAGALMGMGAAGKEAIPHLAKIIRDRDRWHNQEGIDAARSAIFALAHVDIDGKTATQELMDLLKDKKAPEDLRERCVNGLEYLGAKAEKAVPLLVSILMSEQREDLVLSNSLEVILGRMGAIVIKPLAQQLPKAGDRGKNRILRVLYRNGPKAAEAAPSVIALIDETGAGSRLNAQGLSFTLAAMGPRAIPALSEAIKSPRPKTRLYSIIALGEMGTYAKRAVPLLVDALKDSDSSIRVQAALALGKIGPGAIEAIPALKACLEDKEGEVRAEAGGALRLIDRPARKPPP
jgi:HEAT repeat protein